MASSRNGTVTPAAAGRADRVTRGRTGRWGTRLALMLAVLAGATAPAAAQPSPAPPEASPPASPSALPPLPAAPAGWTLKGVVVLSRHGMRAPTHSVHCDGAAADNCLNAVAEQPWPTLGVAAGHLTISGSERSRRLAQFYRAHYAGQGLFPAEGCPDPDRVAYVTDGVERTIVTAGAMMDGMFPGCFLHPLKVKPGLYHGPKCGYEPAAAMAASQALAGGSFAALEDGALAGAIAQLDKVLGPFRPEGCAANGASAPCSLATLPRRAETPGAIRLASPLTEQFLMQYGMGLPENEVAWGRLPGATGLPLGEAVGAVNLLHATSERLMNMPHYQAEKLGSPVAAPVLKALEQLADGRGPAFTFFSSHDTLILNAAGLLGLSWQLPGFHPYQVPPGGGIAFELWQPPTGEPMLRPVYYAQTLDQLRSDAELSDAAPPSSTLVAIESCTGGSNGFCPWSSFRAMAGRAIDPHCVGPRPPKARRAAKKGGKPEAGGTPEEDGAPTAKPD
ncbi:histidine-type phosphatase [Ancylobacter lacus]|uniref:histidine-type phosphatase n=1 Tax=Ancylobacter lacus TaxID=2579970 RepID=UPI001BD0EE4D|nr:histidine-type phosphatase [Ancylobacter lacus]MBS7541410.1 histidine-type phosphatase [Ancylobacter lacus]